MSKSRVYEENVWQTTWQFLPGITKFLSVLGLAVTLFVAVGLLSQAQDQVPYEADSDLIRPYSISVGKQDAELSLVYIVDYQCPVCGQNVPVTSQIKEEFGDRIRFVYKHNPIVDIHVNALQASRAVQAAGNQGKGSEFGDRVLQGQSEGLTNANFERWARDLELDVDKFNQDRRSSEINRIVDFDKRDINNIVLPASSVSGESKPAGQGVGTPTYVIVKNGEIADWWGGALPYEQIKQKLESQLAVE